MILAGLGVLVCLQMGATIPKQEQPTVAPIPVKTPVLVQEGWVKYYGCSYDTPKAADCPYKPRTTWDKIAKGHGLTLCADCDGWAARRDCSTIGSIFYANFGNHTYKLMQTDCSADADYARHVNEQLVLEVPYWIAVETNMIPQKFGRLWGTIWN